MAGFSNSGFEAEGAIDRGLAMDGAPAKESTGFVSVNVGSLSVLADKEAKPSPRVIKSFSRKGSQRSTEKKAAEEDAISGGAHTGGKIAVAGHVAVIEGAVPLFAASTAPTSTKMRRLGSGSCRPSLWLDPRKVLFFFATVSSVGTLILLYFTLSTGKITGGRDGSGGGGAEAEAV